MNDSFKHKWHSNRNRNWKYLQRHLYFTASVSRTVSKYVKCSMRTYGERKRERERERERSVEHMDCSMAAGGWGREDRSWICDTRICLRGCKIRPYSQTFVSLSSSLSLSLSLSLSVSVRLSLSLSHSYHECFTVCVCRVCLCCMHTKWPDMNVFFRGPGWTQ